MARFGIVYAVGRDDPLERLVAYGEFPAALATRDAEFHERPDTYGELSVSLFHLLLALRVLIAAARRLFELYSELLGDAAEGSTADLEQLSNFALGVIRCQFCHLLNQLCALFGTRVDWGIGQGCRLDSPSRALRLVMVSIWSSRNEYLLMTLEMM